MSQHIAKFLLIKQNQPQLSTTSNDWLSSFIHSAYVQSFSYVPHTILGAGDASGYKPDKNVCFIEFPFKWKI